MTFLDLFAGIGGFRLGMEQAGHHCIGFCEIDDFARRSYKAIYDTSEEVEMYDITSVSDEFIQSSDQWISFAADFRAKLFQLRENGKDFPILEVLYSLKSLGSPLFSNLSFYSLRTSGDYSITKEGLRSRQSSERWMDWGMMWNGKCLTQRPTFPKAASGFFLIGHSRDICTEQVFPIIESSATSDQNLRNLLNTNPSNRGMSEQVYGSDEFAPTVTGDEGIKIALPVNDGISVVGMLPGNF